MVKNEIEHKTVATSVVTFSKPSESSRADYQIHMYFLYEEKKPFHFF